MKNTYIYLVLILILPFIACNEDALSSVVEIDIPEHESRLVAIAHFNTVDSLLQVLVSKSESAEASSITGNEFEVIENATVELYKNDQLFEELLFNPMTRKYEALLDMPIKVEDATYRLEVSAANYDPISAVQIMPASGIIENAAYKEDVSVDAYGGVIDEVQFDVIDPAVDEANYFRFDVWATYEDAYTGEQYEINLGYYTDDPLIEYNRLSDASFEGSSYRVRLKIWSGYYGGYGGDDKKPKSIRVAVESLTRENFLYYKSLRQFQSSQGNPFVEPVVVFDNIEGGYGIFTLATTNYFITEL